MKTIAFRWQCHLRTLLFVGLLFGLTALTQARGSGRGNHPITVALSKATVPELIEVLSKPEEIYIEGDNTRLGHHEASSWRKAVEFLTPKLEEAKGALVEMLKSDNPATRENALTVLLRGMRDKNKDRQGLAPQVIPLLADPSWSIRRLALYFVSNMRGDEVEVGLLETLRSAEKALTRTPGDEGDIVKEISEILRLLSGPVGLGADREEQLGTVMLRLLDRPSSQMVALEFCARKYRNGSPFRKALLPKYRSIFAKGGNKTVAAAAETGCFYGDAWFLPFLRLAASDKDEKIRVIGIRWLVEDPGFDPIAQASLLKTFAGDQSPLLRLNFIIVFCNRLKGVDPTHQLKIALQMTEKDPDTRVRKHACEAAFAVLKRVEPDQRRQLINAPDIDIPARMIRGLAGKELRDIIVWQTSVLAAPEKMEPTAEKARAWWASQKEINPTTDQPRSRAVRGDG